MKTKIILTAENYFQVKKYLRRPEWEHPDFGWFVIKSVDFQTGILVGERYDKELGEIPIENTELVDFDTVQLKYQQLLEKLPSDFRDELEDVVYELESYASARGYNGCF